MGHFSAARKVPKRPPKRGLPQPLSLESHPRRNISAHSSTSARKTGIDTSINHHRCRSAVLNLGFAPTRGRLSAGGRAPLKMSVRDGDFQGEGRIETPFPLNAFFLPFCANKKGVVGDIAPRLLTAGAICATLSLVGIASDLTDRPTRELKLIRQTEQQPLCWLRLGGL